MRERSTVSLLRNTACAGRIEAQDGSQGLPKGSRFVGPSGRPAEVRALACPRCGLLQTYVSLDGMEGKHVDAPQPSFLQDARVQNWIIVGGAIALAFVIWAVFFNSPVK